MKKLFLSLFAAFAIAFSANAQFYGSGSLGLMIGGRSETFSVACHIDPGFGYQFNSHSSLGMFFSIGGGAGVFTWSVNPYYRYTFASVSNFHFFGEAQASVGQTAAVFNWGIGLVPGVAYSLSSKVDLITRVGYLGVIGVKNNAAFQFSLVDGTSIGVQFKF